MMLILFTQVRVQTFTVAGEVMHERIHQLPFDFSRLLEGNFICTAATAFRRALWYEVGRYDERLPVRASPGASFVMNGGPIC